MVQVQLQDVLEGLDLPERPKTSIEEYIRYYQPDVGSKPGHDQYMCVHPNGVSCLGVTKQHPLVKAGRELKAKGSEDAQIKIDFGELEHLKSGTGKKKVGDKWIYKGHKICTVTVGTEEFDIVSMARKAKLMGCNDRVRQDPWRIVDRPQGEGHLVTLFLLNVGDLANESSLISPEAYAEKREVDVGELGLAG
ncbi:hypothetical protein BSKO_01648 [Bryopsis sp. KO-2023]|nr:hypothetical protein BSKO_01648 [Bryopsis sp. KO-2023]